MLIIKNDNTKEIVIIEGVKYHHDIFKHFAKVGEIFKVIDKKDGTVSILSLRAKANGTELEKELYNIVSQVEKEAGID